MSGLSRPGLSDILFWLIAGASAVLVVTLALVLAGVIPVGTGESSDETSFELPR